MWGNDPVGVGGEGGGRIHLRTKEIEVDCIHCKGTGGRTIERLVPRGRNGIHLKGG